jgi:hypothetical protein
MDLLVALPAENQGLAPTRCHPSDPEGFLPPPWLAQVSEFADVVNFAVHRGAAPFACLSEKALDHLTTIAVYLLRLIVEDSLLVPSQLDAAKPCHQWQPSSAAFLDDAQDGFGGSHLAYLTSLVVRSPVPLRPVPGVTGRPGRS